MAYPQGPYERHSTLPVESRPLIGPARKINFATKRYELDDNGSFQHMPPNSQRVVILVLKNVPIPKFNTLQVRNGIAQAIRNALQPLQNESLPAIELLEVSVTKEGPEGISKFVRFRDLGEDTHPVTTVQLP